MSFEVRSEDVDLVCSSFPGASDAITGICNWMRQEFQVGDNLMADGFAINSPTTALIIGTRQIFIQYAKESLNAVRDHPLRNIAEHQALDFVLYLEDAEFPSQIYQFRNAFGKEFTGTEEERNVYFGSRIIRDPAKYKMELDVFLQAIILADDAILSRDGKLTPNQIETLQAISPTKVKEVTYGNSEEEFIAFWNGLVSERLLERISNRMPSSFTPRVKKFLATIPFHFFTRNELDQAMRFMIEAIPDAVARSVREKFITADDPKFRKLTDTEVKEIKAVAPDIANDDLVKLCVDPSSVSKIKTLMAALPEDDRTLPAVALQLKGKIRMLTEVSRKRKLTPEELTNLLEVVRYPGSYDAIAGVAEERVRDTLRKQLVKIELEPEYIPHLRGITAERFQGALIPNRHPVGLIAAQALGENASQAGLRSFHHAGITGDTGFDRIKAVTDMPSVEKTKNPFTSIALKGNPNRRETEIYAHKIEQTYIGDICEMMVGRTSEDVPEMSTIFGQSPVFESEAGGWQETYISLLMALGASSDSARGSFERPDWVILMTFDSDKLFQRRISMANIAEVIERERSDLRVIISDIRTAQAEIYFTGRVPAGLPGDEPNQDFHSFLSSMLVPDLRKISIQGVPGFSKTIVEKYDLIPFVLESSLKPSLDVLALSPASQTGTLVVKFAYQDIILNGVPTEQIISLLAIKGGVPEADVEHVGKQVYEIRGSKLTLKEFRAKLIAQETIKLEDAVIHPIMMSNSSVTAIGHREPTTIFLNRDFLRKQNDVSVELMMEFFTTQNELPQFSGVEIQFDRKTFEVTIQDAADFTPENIYERIKAQLPEGQVEFFDSSIGELQGSESSEDLGGFRIEIDAETPVEGLEILSRDYIDALDIRLDATDLGQSKKGALRIELLKPDHLKTWHKLIIFQSQCEAIPTTFVAEAREKYAHRYRILARGVGTAALSRLHYVNIYATIPSVPWEIFSQYDIEATRCYVNSELVLNGGADVGNRHLGMVADALTYMGYPIKMKKSGKEAMKAGVLATASFQEALGVMIDMSAANVHDELKSSAGMTLKGDFTAGEAEGLRSKKEAAVDSAIALMMSSTATVRRAKKIIKAPKREVKPQPSRVIDRSEFDPEPGFL